MMNNSTVLKTTLSYAGCSINWETVFVAWYATDLVTSLASFVGNILLIVVVYRTGTMRTPTDYFVVNMAASDIFLPFSFLVDDIVFKRKDAGYLSQTTGAVLCKLFYFFTRVSYGVSILSLSVITVYRFYAIAFPLRARMQNSRTRIILLFLTWLVPIAMSSPWLFFVNFSLKYHFCSFELNTEHLRVLNMIYLSFFFFLPLLVMLVLYPVILVTLRRQRIPGNTNCSQAVIRRRKQNLRLTTMFITITVAFILCWGMNRVMYLINLFSLVTDWCTFFKASNVVVIFPLIFHAINPVIYFIFCSSYRQGIKQLVSCCLRRVHDEHAPGGDQIELDNMPSI